MKITCAFRYELYVVETRRAALSRNPGCRRFVFNKALGIPNERKSKGEKLLTYKELAHGLLLWKKIEKRIAGLKRKLSLNQESRRKLAKLGRAEPFDKRQPSRKRRRLKERIQNPYRKIRCIRQDFNRKMAHALAQAYGCVYVQDLKVKNMMASAKGTVENPGKNVKQKSGLNRAILRTGFCSLCQAIEWQLLKVGGVVIPVDPRGTSITCPHCQIRDKCNRPTQAIFKCINESCGFKANADVWVP